MEGDRPNILFTLTDPFLSSSATSPQDGLIHEQNELRVIAAMHRLWPKKVKKKSKKHPFHCRNNWVSFLSLFFSM